MAVLEQQWAQRLGPYMRVAVLCGGPGLRREASMECARTAVAHLDTLARFGDGAALCPCAHLPLPELEQTVSGGYQPDLYTHLGSQRLNEHCQLEL